MDVYGSLWFLYAYRCSQLSARQLLFLTQQLASIAKQEAGQSMLHIIVAALADMLEALPVEPPYPTIAPPPGARQATAESARTLSAIAPAVSYAGDASQHRQRGGNRRLPSVREQQAESKQLQQQQEALLVQPAHASMRQTRQKLPAFSKRKDLLTKLSQHSVIVISGATGMTCFVSQLACYTAVCPARCCMRGIYLARVSTACGISICVPANETV